MKIKQTLMIIGLILCVLTVPTLADNAGKVQIFGGDIHIQEHEQVNGDSVAIFADQQIYGKVTGSAVTIFGDLTLKGEVDEVVTIFGEVNLMEGAVIRGDLVNVMGSLKRFGDATILGEVTTVGVGNVNFRFMNNMNNVRFPGVFIRRTFGFGNLLLSIIATALIIHFFLPYLKRTAQVAEEDPLGMGIKGFIATIAIGIIMILLTITILGIPVALVLSIAIWAASTFANVAIYLLMGDRLAEKMEWDVNPYALGIIGTVLIHVVGTVPIFGGIIKFIVACIGLGAVVETKFGTGEQWIR